MAEHDEWGEGGWGDTLWGGELSTDDTAAYTPDDSVWRTTVYEDTTLELLDGLPEYLNNDIGTNNAALLAGTAEQINRLDNDLAAIERETRVQTAEQLGSLNAIATLVDLERRDAEPLEHFRARVLGHMHAESSHGTLNELLVGVARMIRTAVRNIRLQTLADRAITIQIPQSRMSDVGMTPQEIADIAEQMVSPTVDITVTLYGTFMFESHNQSGLYGDDYGATYGAEDSNYQFGFISMHDTGTDTGGTMSALVDEEDAAPE